MSTPPDQHSVSVSREGELPLNADGPRPNVVPTDDPSAAEVHPGRRRESADSSDSNLRRSIASSRSIDPWEADDLPSPQGQSDTATSNILDMSNEERETPMNPIREDIEDERKKHRGVSPSSCIIVQHSLDPSLAGHIMAEHGYLDFGDKLTDESKFWDDYLHEAITRDKDMLSRWSSNMDALLTFSGLFSAVVTAFVIEFYTQLQPDPQQTANTLLADIAQSIHDLANNISMPSAVPSTQQDQPTASVTFVNCAWFASLACTLAVSLIILLVKQLIAAYSMNLEVGSKKEQVLRRQFRRDALTTWHVPGLIDALPTILHTSLGLFLVGLVVQLQTINTSVFVITAALVGFILAFYLFTTVAPLINSSCPF
ncbi:hypothetical protein PLICRDRAFT_148174, partial [Plicaturopsis crispa FD-325 SS-3]